MNKYYVIGNMSRALYGDLQYEGKYKHFLVSFDKSWYLCFIYSDI
jgi:hypothetical protein